MPEIAFLGRSNVGKSLLLNALTGVKGLARVSAQPGRTRLVNFFRAGNALYLVDLPGYGYARAAASVRAGFEALVTSYLVGRDPLRLSVFLVDIRHEPSEADETLRVFLEHHGIPYVVAATKKDKLGRGEAERRRAQLERGLGQRARGTYAVSSETGEGVKELWRVLWRSALEPQA